MINLKEQNNWIPTEKQNLGIVTKTYDCINKRLEKLQEETSCPDLFVYEFLDAIKKEWDPKSCQSIVRSNKANCKL